MGIFAQSELAQAVKNPYELARYLNSHEAVDWKQVWRLLGAEPADPNCERLGCAVDGVITIPMPSQAILVIDGAPGQSFLRFFEEKGGWRYAGTQFTDKARGYGVDRSGSGPLLRVENQCVSGSGWYAECVTLYDPSATDFEPFFRFTSYGWAIGYGATVSRTIYGRVEIDQDRIVLDSRVNYSINEELDLGSAEYRATYSRVPREKRFSISKIEPGLGSPPISAAEFDDLANLIEDKPANDRLIVYTLTRLKEIASGSNPEAKDWLRSVLMSTKDTPEKQLLQSMLDRK